MFPSLLDLFSSWKDLGEFGAGWLGAMAGLQLATLACLWALQHVAIRAQAWPPVIASQLAGNALSKIAPGGGAVGAALQYRMLVQAGAAARDHRLRPDRGRTCWSSRRSSALPVLAVPTIIRGGVDHGLVAGRRSSAPWSSSRSSPSAPSASPSTRRCAGSGARSSACATALRRHSEPLTGLPKRLLHERDRILETFGPKWKRALAATVGRWAFDYATLLAALAAVGSRPRPALVLLAFCGAQILAQIPVTPGGLGFVEAGLTAMLKLAGVPAGAAVLATFAYRLFSYWLPLPLGAVGFVAHRRRYPAPG